MKNQSHSDLSSPFTWLNSINAKADYLIEDDISEKLYNAFIVNRGLSQFQDAILFANEMNRNHSLDKKMQYDFLYYAINKKKRFSKWAKKEEDNVKKMALIKTYFGYSEEKARQVINIINDSDCQMIEQHLNKGGKSERRTS